MTAAGGHEEMTREFDAGEYCRQVEAHLTKVNGGHLVRIVGPGFDLVRRWAEEGVPLNIVRQGIERKAERHQRGRSARPLRIEFCEADVREIHDEWRRAIGVQTSEAGESSRTGNRKPSLPRHFERVLDRLGRLTGRLDWPDQLRDGLESCRGRLVTLQATAVGARGEARDHVVSQLAALDRELLELARQAAPAGLREEVRREAEADLAPYRDRLSGPSWRESVDVTFLRLLRDRLGLPTLELPI